MTRKCKLLFGAALRDASGNLDDKRVKHREQTFSNNVDKTAKSSLGGDLDSCGRIQQIVRKLTSSAPDKHGTLCERRMCTLHERHVVTRRIFLQVAPRDTCSAHVKSF